MKFFFRTLLVLVLSIGFNYYYFLIRPIPKRSGEQILPNLKSSVHIKFDEFGIPHLKANSEEDAFFSLGYLIAQHRLFQMDIQRRVATGRLSEVIGEKSLELDKLNRNLGFSHYSKKLAAKKAWPEEADRLMESYLKGVNLCVDQCVLPIEFKILNYKPDYFHISDVIAFIGYMSFGFEEAFDLDPLINNLSAELESSKFNELIHSYEDNGPSIDKTNTKSFLQSNRKEVERIKIGIHERLETALKQNSQFGLQLEGSNSWIVSGKLSHSGMPILANDPHIRHSNPNIWFEAALNVNDQETYGYFLPLVPFPILGNTKHHAWALTMSEVDDLDLYIHKISDNKILSKIGAIPIEQVTEDILVKNHDSFPYKLRTSKYGPMMDSFLLSDNQEISVYWPFYSSENSTMESLFLMYKAKNFPEFQRALSKLTGPGLNISYVDNEDNIAWYATGKYFDRDKNDNGLFIKNSAKHAPMKFLDFSQNPHLVNPPDNRIITANHRVSNANIEKFPGYYQPSDRARRIIQLLDSKEKFTPEDFSIFINDTKDDLWPKVKEVLIENLKQNNHPAAIELLSSFSEWEAFADSSSREYLIYKVWLNNISYFAMVDEIGENDFSKFFRLSFRYNLTKRILQNESSQWWDDINTKSKETRSDILNKAFQKSIEFLNTKLGTNSDNWSWGQLHQLELSHPLGKFKPLNYIFNIGPAEVDGGYSIVSANASREHWEKFNVESGPSTRRIIDMKKPSQFLSILPSGISGHIADRHYKDQWNMYLQGTLRPATLDFNSVVTENYLVFLPQ